MTMPRDPQGAETRTNERVPQRPSPTARALLYDARQLEGWGQCGCLYYEDESGVTERQCAVCYPIPPHAGEETKG